MGCHAGSPSCRKTHVARARISSSLKVIVNFCLTRCQAGKPLHTRQFGKCPKSSLPCRMAVCKKIASRLSQHYNSQLRRLCVTRPNLQFPKRGGEISLETCIVLETPLHILNSGKSPCKPSRERYGAPWTTALKAFKPQSLFEPLVSLSAASGSPAKRAST